MPAIIRNPVPGAPLPNPLPCKHDGCKKKREQLGEALLIAHRDNPKKTASPDFECPQFRAPCQKSAFLYPRKAKVEPAFPEGYQFHYHQGIDLPGVDGKTQIISVVDGEVLLASREKVAGFGGYGRVVHIKGSDGRYYLHAHCAEVLVSTGQKVAQKQPIAIVGRTGFETPEEAEHEQKHCDALAEWRKNGAQGTPPPPPTVKLTNKSGKEYTMNWMGPHLHFEVSKQEFGSKHAVKTIGGKKIKVDRSTEDEDKDVTENPLEVLESLGPWGEKKYPFPEGTEINLANAKALVARAEDQPHGGYFPLGANNTWHGGVHIFGKQATKIVSPLPGTIVAARLDENPASAHGAFGSSNFILVRHEIPPEVMAKWNPAAAQAESSAGRTSTTSAGTAPTGGPRFVGNPPPKNKPRGPKVVNDPTDVVEAKRMLRAHGYYHPANEEDAASGTKLDGVAQAITDFQTAIPNRKWTPDGTAKVGGTTFRLMAQMPASQQPGTSEPEARPSLAPATARTLYSLYMHLEAVPLDAKRVESFGWLGRAQLPLSNEEKAAEASAKAKRDEAAAKADADAKARADRIKAEDEPDVAEARHTLRASVGGDPDAREKNRTDDVTWVQMRLSRFGYFPKEKVNGVVTSDLETAIRTFQTKHAPGSGAKGYVRPGKSTEKALKRTKRDLGLIPADPEAAAPEKVEPAPPMQGKALSALRMRDAQGQAQVVTGLNVQVSEGDELWTLGVGAAAGGSLTPYVHWEMFSEHALFGGWARLEDTTADIRMDACETLIAQVEGEDELRAEDIDAVLTQDEVQRFYASGRANFLHHTQCRFWSEWALNPDAMPDAIRAMGMDVPADFANQVRPYMWWPKATGVVPASPIVWHYNPIVLMWEYVAALPVAASEAAGAGAVPNGK